jgi:hypothetical protein
MDIPKTKTFSGLWQFDSGATAAWPLKPKPKKLTPGTYAVISTSPAIFQ